MLEEGFLAKINPISKSNSKGTCEILVPRIEAEEVHSILFDFGF